MHSFLLNFALAEEYELQGQLADAHYVYNTFLEKWAIELDKIKAAIVSTPQSETPPATNDTKDKKSGTESNEMSTSTDPICKLLKLRIKEVGQAWIMWYRFARRSEGFTKAREIFTKAKKSKHLDWRTFDFVGKP